jgi:hypothetical protein
MCALRWSDRDRREGATSVLRIERSIFVNDGGQLEEKDTKTHQQRRVIPDPEPDAILDEQEQRARERAAAASIAFNSNGFIFSPLPTGACRIIRTQLPSGMRGSRNASGSRARSRISAITTRPS